jgi:hypothetical protein
MSLLPEVTIKPEPEVFLDRYEIHWGTNHRGQPTLMVIEIGKTKPLMNFYAARRETLENSLNEFKKKKMERIAEKAEEARLREEAKKQGNPYKVDDLLYDSWGYDQTNIDFYQVVEVKGWKVILRRIGSEHTRSGDMSGDKKPAPNSFLTNHDPIEKIVQIRVYDNKIRFIISSPHGGWLSRTTADEEHSWSSYH